MARAFKLTAERQKHLLESWQSLLKHPLPSTISQVIDRKNTDLPADYVWQAPAIAIASESLLKAARRVQQGYRWRKHKRYGYYYAGEVCIKQRSGFWFIEREGQVLVFRLSSMPICALTHHDAISLFEHVYRRFDMSYDPPLGSRGYDLHWVEKAPAGISVVKPLRYLFYLS